jgi:hypothetical protein
MIGLLALVGCVTTTARDDAPTPPSLAAAAIRYEASHLGIAGAYLFKLPPATRPSNAPVRKRLGNQAYHEGLSDVPAGPLPVIEIVRAQAQFWLANVDLVSPVDPGNPHGESRVVTLRMRWEAPNGWYVDHREVWKLPVEEALRVIRSQDLAPPANPEERPSPPPEDPLY